MNKFLAYLIELSFTVLFFIIFLVIHYILINRTKLNTKLKQSKVLNFWYFFGIGAILSLITFIVSQATALSISENIGLSCSLLSLIVAMAFFYNRSIQVGAYIPTIIAVIWSYNGFNEFSWTWAARVILVTVIAIVSIASTFFKTKKWPTYLISLVVIAGLCIGQIFLFNDLDTTFDLIQLGFSFVTAILFYWILWRVNYFFDRMSYMAKTNLYTDEGYIIPSEIENQFDLLLRNNNIEQALVVTFDVSNDDKDTLIKLAEKFKSKDSLLFKTTYGTYGVILIDNDYRLTNIKNSFLGNNLKNRKGDDPLAYLDFLIKDFNITAFVSVYGIHSNNLNELIWFNQYASKQFDKSSTSNSVQLFNSNILNNQIKDEVSYAQLKQKINLNEIEINLETIQFNSRKQKYIYPRFFWTKEFTCDLNKIVYQFDTMTSNALLRSLAIKSIEAYSISNNKQYPLLINYPILELSNPFFPTNEFIKKLQLYGLDKTNIVLLFDAKQIKIWSNVIIDNFKELEVNGIHYILIDLNNTYPLSHIHPKYVILDKTISDNKNKLEKALSIIKQYKHNVLLSK